MRIHSYPKLLINRVANNATYRDTMALLKGKLCLLAVENKSRKTIQIKPLNKDKLLHSHQTLPISKMHKENLWENPPEASSALKSIFKDFKHTFNASDKWDGDFVL